jgi:hypothetical protein
MAPPKEKIHMASNRKALALSALGTVGTAAALGYFHGKEGNMPKIADKVPYDVAATLLAVVGIAFESKLKKFAPILVSAGLGGASYFAGSYAGQWGQKARFEAKKMQGPPGYLAGEDQRATAPWRNERTITAGRVPVAGPVNSYQGQWRR